MVAFHQFKIEGLSFKSFLTRILFSSILIFSSVAHADSCDLYLEDSAIPEGPSLELLMQAFEEKADKTKSEKLTQRLGLSGIILSFATSPLVGNFIDNSDVFYMHAGIVTFFGMVLVPKITQKLRAKRNVQELYANPAFMLNFKRAINPEFHRLLVNFFEKKNSISNQINKNPNHSFKSLEDHLNEMKVYEEALSVLKTDLSGAILLADELVKLASAQLNETKKNEDPNPMNIANDSKATQEALHFVVNSQNILRARLKPVEAELEQALYMIERIKDLTEAYRGYTSEEKILENNLIHYLSFKNALEKLEFSLHAAY